MMRNNSAYEGPPIRRRPPNPWIGQSMFRSTKNRPSRVIRRPVFTSRKNQNQNVNVNTLTLNNLNKLSNAQKNKLDVQIKKRGINARTKFNNLMKTRNNSKVLLNKNANTKNRNKAAQNIVNRVGKYYTEYMYSEGPSSGAAGIVIRKIAASLPIEAKAAAAAVVVSGAYGAVKFADKHRKRVIPAVVAILGLVAKSKASHRNRRIKNYLNQR
jgi:hypothetical protein